MDQAEQKTCVRKCKEDYKNKIQAQFKQNNTKQAWHSVKSITGCNKSNKRCSVSNCTKSVNDLNTFYCRFDCHYFEVERYCAVQCANLLPEHTFDISRDDVASDFKNVKVNKAAGPNKITGELLKNCHLQLFCFNYVLNWVRFPYSGKPQRLCQYLRSLTRFFLNDYRSIAVALHC